MTRVALVGSGKWGINLARNFHELGALGCICEIREERIEELRKDFDGIRICSEISSVLGDSTIDALVVATQPASHYELGMKALQAGKHVFIEKPMTLEVSQSEELTKTAGRLRRILMVGHILLYNPVYVKLKQIIDGGDLGDIRHLHAQRIGLGRVRREEDVLFSLAPHDISIMLHFFSESPEALSCFGMDYLQDGINDFAYLHLRFPGKRMGHIFVSWLSPVKIRQHTVVGTKKMAQIDELVGKGSLKVFDRFVDPHTLVAHNGEAVPVECPEREPLREECIHFLESVARGKTPRSDGCQGLEVVRILAAAYGSMKRKGEWIELSKVC